MTDPEMLSWFRAAIAERKALAEALPTAPWYQKPTPSGPLPEVFGGDGFVAATAVRAEAAHIAANDPRDTIARCEAELAILDLYEATAALVQQPPVMPEGHPHAGKISARDYMDARRELCVLEPVISFVAAGYRHHPGWKAEWAS